jgi:hypothetical protein
MWSFAEQPIKLAITAFGGFVAFSTAAYNGATFVDSRYAHDADVTLIEMRLEQKILTDRSSQIQQRIWKIEDRYPDMSQAPETVQEEYRQLKRELYSLDQELNTVQQEYKQRNDPMPSRPYYDGPRRSAPSSR